MRLARIVLTAAAITLCSSALGIAFNALRAKGIPWVAPFPYEQDCPVKLPKASQRVDAAIALSLLGSERVMDERGRKGAILVDAREEHRFRDSHLPGAKSHPYSFITPFSPQDGRALGRFAHIFVYCDTPDDHLARLLAQQMKKVALTQVKVVNGGLRALQAANKAQKKDGP